MLITDKEWSKLQETCPEVKVANLHQAIHAAGAINTDKTLSDIKTRGIKLYWKSDGLYYEVRSIRGCIPAANVANLVFIPAPAAEIKKSA